MGEQLSSEIEFNSMVAILKRLDMITYGINRARVEGKYSTMCDALIDYFKEISPDLTDKEMEILKQLNKLRRLTHPLAEERVVWISIQLDKTDIELRKLAKKHGYLTKNIKNVKAAIIDM